MIYYICCTNGAILLYEYFLWEKSHHRRFQPQTSGDEHSSPTVYEPAVMTPSITNDLNPTPPKPAVMLILNRR